MHYGQVTRSGSQRGTDMQQPVPAEMLFAAIHEREVALARVSRLLHDDVSQVLSAVGLQLDAMRMDFRERVPEFDERTEEIQHLLEQAIGQLRDISNELNPSVVERAGLFYALERLVGRLGKNFGGSLRLQADPEIHVPTPLGKAFYKIAEWALNSATARPGCTKIEVQLKRSRGNVVLEVSDDGKPGPAEDGTPSLDRLLINYHATQSQIDLTVQAPPAKGTVIRAAHATAKEAKG